MFREVNGSNEAVHAASWEVGKRYPDMQTYQCRSRIHYDGIWNLTIEMPDVTDQEVRGYQQGKLQMALADISGVLFLLYKFDGHPWCDVPYEPRLTLEPMQYPQIADEALGISLQVNVYDSATGILKVCRIIGLPNALSNHLHLRCNELDTKRPMDAASHYWKVNQVYKKYRKTADMLREVKKIYNC